MTPLEISILIHYYGIATDFREGDFSAPVVRQAIDWFVVEGMLDFENSIDSRKYKLTDKGNFFVEWLCSQPLPVISWKIPNE